MKAVIINQLDKAQIRHSFHKFLIDHEKALRKVKLILTMVDKKSVRLEQRGLMPHRA